MSRNPFALILVALVLWGLLSVCTGKPTPPAQPYSVVPDSTTIRPDHIELAQDILLQEKSEIFKLGFVPRNRRDAQVFLMAWEAFRGDFFRHLTPAEKNLLFHNSEPSWSWTASFNPHTEKEKWDFKLRYDHFKNKFGSCGCPDMIVVWHPPGGEPNIHLKVNLPFKQSIYTGEPTAIRPSPRSVSN